jgi:hypothetical protein
MFEHYGNWNYISTLISNQLNGIPGVESTLNSLGYAQSFDDAFEQWIIANYVDDSVYDGGKYGYSHYDFAPCVLSDIHSTFPLSTVQSTVNPYAADYIGFTSSTSKTITIAFNGQSDSKFRVDIILKNTSNDAIDSIISMPLDSVNHGTFVTTGFGSDYDLAVMTVMNIDSTIHENITASYSYSAAETSGVKENTLAVVEVFPNPATDLLYLTVPGNGMTNVTLQDIQGRLHYNGLICGSGIIDIRSLADGVYILKATGANGCFTEKIMKY